MSGGGLTDDLRAQLTHLESLTSPSEYNRGVLSAIRLHATADADQRRTEELAARWAEDQPSG